MPEDENLVAKLQLEIAKQIIVSRLEVIKTAAATLQTLNGLFLTAYIAFLAAVRSNPGFTGFDLFGAIWPIPLFVISLVLGFVVGVANRGFWIVVGDLDDAVQAYEQIVQSRRRQLIIPGLITFMGLILAVYRVLLFHHTG